MALPPQERTKLTKMLVDRVGESLDSLYVQEWSDEIEKRLDAHHRGGVTGVTIEQLGTSIRKCASGAKGDLKVKAPPLVEAEAIGAALGCDEQRPGLGADFCEAIIYEVTENEIIVAAITHASREPGYWLDRLPSRERRGD